MIYVMGPILITCKVFCTKFQYVKNIDGNCFPTVHDVQIDGNNQTHIFRENLRKNKTFESLKSMIHLRIEHGGLGVKRDAL